MVLTAALLTRCQGSEVELDLGQQVVDMVRSLYRTKHKLPAQVRKKKKVELFWTNKLFLCFSSAAGDEKKNDVQDGEESGNLHRVLEIVVASSKRTLEALACHICN